MSHYTPQGADSHETLTIEGGEGACIGDMESGQNRTFATNASLTASKRLYPISSRDGTDPVLGTPARVRPHGLTTTVSIKPKTGNRNMTEITLSWLLLTTMLTPVVCLAGLLALAMFSEVE